MAWDRSAATGAIAQHLTQDVHQVYWPARTHQSKKGTLTYLLHCWRRSVGYCEWIGIRRGSMHTTVPSTRYSRASVQSATLRLLTLYMWSAGSTPRLIVALTDIMSNYKLSVRFSDRTPSCRVCAPTGPYRPTP